MCAQYAGSVYHGAPADAAAVITPHLTADIYGGDYTKFGLPGSLTASFFGKLATVDSDGDPRAGLKDVDVCRALIVMLSQNITQIA